MVTTRKLQTIFKNELSSMNEIKLALHYFSFSYKSVLSLGNFNLTKENPNLENLRNIFDLESLIKIVTHRHLLLALISFDK